MCIAAVGLPGILGAIGTVVSAVGTFAGAQAQANAATFKQKQEKLLAEDALKRGAQEEEAHRRKVSALQGRQTAVLAASNVDIGSGSPLAVLGDTAQLGELDAQVIKDNARRQQQFHNTNAQFAGMEASAAKSAGMIGAFSTVLGGATKLAGQWYDNKPASTSTASDPWGRAFR